MHRASIGKVKADHTCKHPPTFMRFLELTSSFINCDLHIHTNRTDGEADVHSIVQRATALGLSQIAFTEHVRRETKWFGDFASDVRRVAKANPHIEILVGCETKACDMKGTLDVSDDILSQCDIVLGSVHRFPNGVSGFVDTSTLTREEFAEIEFLLSSALLDSDEIDVLAHPGSMFVRRFKEPFPTYLMQNLILKSLERRIAIEINSSHLPDFNGFISLCDEVNPFVSIGSDVHSPDQLGRCRDLLLAERSFVS